VVAPTAERGPGSVLIHTVTMAFGLLSAAVAHLGDFGLSNVTDACVRIPVIVIGHSGRR